MLITHIKNYLASQQKFKVLLLLALFHPVFAETEESSPAVVPPLTQANTVVDHPLPSTENAALDNTPEYVIIRSNDQITFSSETAASVAKISVKEGSQFLKGDILLELDCRIQQAELSKAIAQQKASALAESSAKKLKNYDSISEFELVKAETDAKISDAEVSKLKAIVEKCTIKAPFNGSVATLMVHPYETVKQGDPLLKIINTENLEFDIEVPSNWLEWLHVNSAVNVHINELNKNFSATVARINPLIEPVSQTVKVIAIISKPDSTLLPGMSGQASFSDDPQNKIEKSKI
ncbi:MAG TPA: efflux RND transporter periplasmic adaptor subunit [Gammaproteobacteria bacterium]|nr:efflux RND transporter periplasmic adaptor subunit [Gammaproteobacteria bacterium]